MAAATLAHALRGAVERGIGVDMAGCGGCEAVGHGQLGSYRQRLQFRKAIAAEVPWYMALVVWLGVEYGGMRGTDS